MANFVKTVNGMIQDDMVPKIQKAHKDALDSLRGSSVQIGTIRRRLAWPLRKDDTHKARSANNCERDALKTSTAATV
jgi:hypothetical protein